MIGTLVWKEYREQRLMWIAVAALAVMFAAVVWQLMPEQRHTPDRLAWQQAAIAILWCGAGVYGAVSGAAVLAGEREEGTLEFLDSLTGRRLDLWRTKIAFAASANIAMLGVLYGLTTSFYVGGLLDGEYTQIAAIGVGILALHTFCWSVFFGTWSKSALAACGWTALAAPLSAFFILLASSSIVVFLENLTLFRYSAIQADRVPAAIVYGMVNLAPLAALYVSYRVFCGDRRGQSIAVRQSTRRLPALAGTTQLLWMIVRQGWVTVLVIGAITMTAALAVASGTAPWGLLPAGLLIGILAGLAAFGSEQAQREQRFLADQRLPVVRVWLVKVGAWLSVAVAAGSVLAVGDPYREAWGTSVAARSPMPWILAGFAVGHLTMLVFRKRIVTVVVAPMLAAPLAGIWFPSLCEGDFYPSLTFVPPLVLLIGGLLSIRLWTAGTLLSRRGIGTLVLSAMLAVGWIAAALWYRAASIVDIGPPFDVAAFQATLAEGRQARAAELIRDAMPAVAGFAEAMSPRNEWSERWLAEQLDSALATPLVDELLDERLDQLFAQPSIRALSELPKLPPGALTQPSDYLSYGSHWYRNTFGARGVALVLLLEAVRETDRDDHAAALEHWAAALAVTNTLRNHTWSLPWNIAEYLDRQAFAVLDRWLAAVPQDSPLIERALDILGRHEMLLPSVASISKIDYLAVRERLENPLPRPTYRWYAEAFWSDGKHHYLELPIGESLDQLVWRAPWEVVRRQRVLDHAAVGWLAVAELPYWEVPAVLTSSTQRHPRRRADTRAYVGNRRAMMLPQAPWHQLNRRRGRHDLDPIDATSASGHYSTWSAPRQPNLLRAMAECGIRGNRLKLALVLFEARHGQPAKRLEQLVPHELASLPIDPFNGEPFRYRISPGETLRIWPADVEMRAAGELGPDEKITVAPDQVIVWSVGPDGHDEDGRIVNDGSHSRWDGDLVFLVPPPRD